VSSMWVYSGISFHSELAYTVLYPGCECDLALSAKLDWFAVLPHNVSRMWECSGISCQTGLADSALKMCPGCECLLAFAVKLHWLTWF